MISRRRIISRSHEVLNDNNHFNPYEFDDNCWISKEKLFRDHIQEILTKWGQIDDEIWSKIICMEKNRRVAKAYARAQVLSINGSDLGFDGYRIGLNGFQNPQRDSTTDEVKKYIGPGAKIKIDDGGNILIKRVSKSNIFINTNTMKADVSYTTNRPNSVVMTCIEFDKSYKLFDLNRFQNDVHKEMRNSYPDRRRLEMQCISCIAFVKEQTSILEHPIWVMLINIVALDMLKSKFPISTRLPKFVSVFERTIEEKPTHNQKHCDRYPPVPIIAQSRDMRSALVSNASHISMATDSRKETKALLENENFAPTSHRNRGLDDLYYCGLQARVPNYGRQRSSIAICANNTGLESKKYYNSSLQLSTTGNEILRKPTNGNYSGEDTVESIDYLSMGNRESRKPPVTHLRNNFDNHIKHNIAVNRRQIFGEF